MVLRKEITETRRDRNLVLQLVIIPALLYPVLGFGAYQVYLIVQGTAERTATVVYADADVPSLVRERLESAQGYEIQTTPDELDAYDAAPAPERFRELRRTWEESRGPAPSALLSWWRAPKAAADSARIVFDASRDRSDDARQELEGAVAAVQDSLVLARAQQVGLTRADVELFDVDVENVASERQVGSYLLSLMLPLFLMIMLAQGTFYSSIDAVVGEKERGTLETVLSSPVPRRDLMLGKFLYVVLSSLLSFLLNLIGMLLFVSFVLKLIDIGEPLQISLPVGNVLLMIAVAFLAAGGLAAVMMLMAVPSKNYREAQTTLMPVYMIASFAGIAVITTDTELSLTQALVPAVNVVAVLKALIRGDAPFLPVVAAMVELALLSLVCTVAAGRLASKEGVFFDPELNLKKLLGIGKASR
jgi:sodium transport system permease protein